MFLVCVSWFVLAFVVGVFGDGLGGGGFEVNARTYVLDKPTKNSDISTSGEVLLRELISSS